MVAQCFSLIKIGLLVLLSLLVMVMACFMYDFVASLLPGITAPWRITDG